MRKNLFRFGLSAVMAWMTFIASQGTSQALCGYCNDCSTAHDACISNVASQCGDDQDCRAFEDSFCAQDFSDCMQCCIYELGPS